MRAPDDHRRFLSRRNFLLDCSAPNFTAEDRKLLTRYGHWLTALAGGEIQPFTAEQEHFLKVAKGSAEPVNDLERAWAKLTDRRKFEAQTRSSPHFEISDPGEEWISREQSWRSKSRHS
jgi:uncharacterized protein YifE (UPF0438 family)